MSPLAAAADPAAGEPRSVHSLPGRVRVHLPGSSPVDTSAIERRLSSLTGVRRARANAQTRNVLIEFDPTALDERGVLKALSKPTSGPPKQEEATPAARAATAIAQAADTASRLPEHAVREVGRLRRRARVAVKGLDRDPDLARRVVERLESVSGVSHVSASQLTGRVLIEYSEHLLKIEDVLGTIARLELPELPGEATPSHPLDPAPLIQSTARVIGAGLGLALVGIQRARAGAAPSGTPGSVGGKVAGAVGIVEGLPPVEQRLESIIGRNPAQLTLSGMAIISLSFAGSPLGLAVAGAGALRLMTTIRARRNAWRDYEERLGDAEAAVAGTTVTIDPGERVPLPGTVKAGFGTTISRTGDFVAVAPGERLDAGARISGGPVTVKLDADPAFTPQRRSTPPSADAL